MWRTWHMPSMLSPSETSAPVLVVDCSGGGRKELEVAQENIFHIIHLVSLLGKSVM